MLLKQDLELTAVYNQWMNQRLYEAASRLDPQALRADKGAFFGSILSTLQHIYAADVHWMKRIAAQETQLAALLPLGSIPLPPLVRAITYPDFDTLVREREAMDAILIAFTREATESLYARPLRYTNTAGQAYTRQLGLVLRHVFNHQTHHRGQATTLFQQSGIDVGITDMSALIPAWEVTARPG